MASGVQAYWPCEDGQLSASIAPGLPGGYPMTVSQGTPSLAADSTFICSAPLPYVNGSLWFGPVANYADTGMIVVRFLFIPSSTLTALGAADIIRIDTYGTAGSVYVSWSGMGSTLQVNSSTLGLIVTGPTISAGQAVWVSLELATGLGSVTPTLRTMSTSGAITSAASTPYAGITGRVYDVVVNPNPVNTGQTVIGPVSHPRLWGIVWIFVASGVWRVAQSSASRVSAVLWSGGTTGPGNPGSTISLVSVRQRVVWPPRIVVLAWPVLCGAVVVAVGLAGCIDKELPGLHPDARAASCLPALSPREPRL